MDQVLGQAGAGLAIGPGVGGAVGPPLGGAVGGAAIDGLRAGVVVIKALMKEGPEGDGWGVEALADGAALVPQGVVDLLGGEVLGQRQPGLGDQRAAGVGDWTGRGAGGRMMPDDFLLRCLVATVTLAQEVVSLTTCSQMAYN